MDYIYITTALLPYEISKSEAVKVFKTFYNKPDTATGIKLIGINCQKQTMIWKVFI